MGDAGLLRQKDIEMTYPKFTQYNVWIVPKVVLRGGGKIYWDGKEK